MKYLLVFLFNLTFADLYTNAGHNYDTFVKANDKPFKSDSLPLVFPVNHADIVGNRLKNEACLRFMQQLVPTTRQELETFTIKLKNEIILKAGIFVDHQLPLDIHETGSVKMEGFTIKNIFFQTLPGVYATGNLYIPDGKGPFPAVINLNGHWQGARLCDQVQNVSQTLALNGYVSLSIDAFGAGERSTVHGKNEYHGANLGASLMNIGTSLMGIQVSENIRGVDLLCSLSYVEQNSIGATGASGGGNQTMWLAAMDERIKAAVPVVSIGTFESYIMESNCVCELLIDGLTIAEESSILALIAPRAILMLNHNYEINPAFYPSEMLRTYSNALPVFEMMGVEKNLNYQLFDLMHDYLQEDREAMLGWFNLHLKKMDTGSPGIKTAFKNLRPEHLMVFASGQRDPEVLNIHEYCRQMGVELRSNLLSSKTFDVELKKKELHKILRISDISSIKDVHLYSGMNGWDRIALETTDGKLIPLLHLVPRDKALGYTILCNSKGKNSIPLNIINELREKGSGIVVVDLFGTGETSSSKANSFDVNLIQFHTLSRTELWLGKTVLSEWINDLDLIIRFLDGWNEATKVSIDASREAGLAALFLSVFHGDKLDSITLREAPVSYLFDTREGIDFFSMGIHLPSFLQWGDVSLAAALSGKNVLFINPVSMSGNPINGEKLPAVEAEFEKIRTLCHLPGKATFK